MALTMFVFGALSNLALATPHHASSPSPNLQQHPHASPAPAPDEIWRRYKRSNIPPPPVVMRNDTLRILPLGDSITNGYASSDGNGYRKIFYDWASEGGKVVMIGSHQGQGQMNQNNEEGWDTFNIDQISYKATNALAARPNVVLLMAGTNDMFTDAQAAKAPQRLESLVDKILKSNANITLLLSGIIPSTDTLRQPRISTYNAAIRAMETRKRQSNRVIYIPAERAVSMDQFQPDGIHPTDAGYKNIAYDWGYGLNAALKKYGGFASVSPGKGYVPPSATPSQDGLVTSGARNVSTPASLLAALLAVCVVMTALG